MMYLSRMKRVIIDLGIYNPMGNNSEKKFDEISITSPDENNRNLFNPSIQTKTHYQIT